MWPMDGHAELVARAHGHAVDEHEWRSPYGELISIARYRDVYDVFLSRYRIATVRNPARLANLVAYYVMTIPYAASITTPDKPDAPPHAAWQMCRWREEGWFSVAVGRVTPAQRDAMERRGWRVAASVNITTTNYHVTINVLTGLSAWPASMEALRGDGKSDTMEFKTAYWLNRWMEAEVAL